MLASGLAWLCVMFPSPRQPALSAVGSCWETDCICGFQTLAVKLPVKCESPYAPSVCTHATAVIQKLHFINIGVLFISFVQCGHHYVSVGKHHNDW